MAPQSKKHIAIQEKLRQFDTQHGDALTVASLENNAWSAMNNYNSDEFNKDEFWRSFRLELLDFVSSFKDKFVNKLDSLGKVNKNIIGASANISLAVIEFSLMHERWWNNVQKFRKVTEADYVSGDSKIDNDPALKYDNGKIPTPVLVDFIADTKLVLKQITTIGENLPALFGKTITPYSVIFNFLSTLFTAISNGIHDTITKNLPPLEDVEYVLDTMFPLQQIVKDAILKVLTDWDTIVDVLYQTFESTVPDILNPWKEPDTIDLIGTNEDDVIDKEGWFDKEKYVIFAHGGNDTITGSRYNDYLDGGADDDKIYGGAGQDVLIGGSGNDLLDGGESKDRLYGGEGIDTYIAQHHDVIVDSDGKGSLFLQTSKGLVYAERFVQDEFDDPNTWFSVDSHGLRDGKLVAQRDDAGNLTVFLDNFDDSVQIEGFFATAMQMDNAYRGLGLTLAKDDGASRSLTTDFNADNQASVRYSTIYVNDAAKSYTVNGGVLDDLIMVNNAQFVQVLAGGGNDRVFGSLNADRIYGGDGHDVLNGSRFINSSNPGLSAEQLALDADIIIGNSGRDIINGFAGDDVIFTEERDSHLVEISTNKGGDWATGGLGNDKIFGSSSRDFLLGGEGGDTIYGGASDDVIIGDGFVRANQKTQVVKGIPESVEWNYSQMGIVSPMPVFQAGQPVGNEYRYSVGKGEIAEKTLLYTFNTLHQDTWSWSADIDDETGDYAIHYSGGTLNFSNNEHRVTIGGDGDFLYGGAGDDLVVGQDGHDYLNGGAGNDILFGDDNRDDTLLGNDTLVAGSGSDKLYGGKGFDIYQFNSKDLLQGDMNTIIDTDNQGAVMLDGIALGDLDWKVTDMSGFWINENQGLSLHLDNNSLLISSDAFGGKIFIQDFVDGALGIKLPTTNKTNDDAGSDKEKLVTIVTGKDSGAFETESGSGMIEADSYRYDDGGMGYWTQWGVNSGAFGD